MFISILFLIVVLTKSASFPFISWLLEAMRAPTPVSSLVHSSTLVAAGVWFLFRYGGGLIPLSSDLEMLFFTLCLATIVISSLCSVIFFDLKKIVALSTCKKVSWCVVFFLFGSPMLGLFQLLRHGVAKCYLFISLGDVMSGSSSAQDSRGVFSPSGGGVFSFFVQRVLVLSLSGTPFIGVFFRKHALLCEAMWTVKIFCCAALLSGFLLSWCYSIRLVLLLCGFGSMGVGQYGCFFLVVSLLSVLFSGLLNVLCVGGSEEFFLLGSLPSLFLKIFQIVGILGGFFFYLYSQPWSFSYGGYILWGCESIVACFYCVCE